jgi:hypothetical protein
VLGAGRHLEGHGENGHSNDNNNANGESHGAPLLEPPPPPPMTHAKMMVEMLAAYRESAYALEMLT